MFAQVTGQAKSAVTAALSTTVTLIHTATAPADGISVCNPSSASTLQFLIVKSTEAVPTATDFGDTTATDVPDLIVVPSGTVDFIRKIYTGDRIYARTTVGTAAVRLRLLGLV